MGTFLDHVVVSREFPVTLPRLCIFITYVEKIDAPRRSVTFQVHLPGDAADKPAATAVLPSYQLPPGPIKTPIGKDATRQSARLALMLSPVTLKEQGEIVVTAHFDGDELELGKLMISYDPNLAVAVGLGRQPAPSTLPT